VSSFQFQTKTLRQKSAPDEYALYRAGLEWDLTDPIVINNRGDLKSEYQWRDRLEPYHHQITNLVTFCRRLPVTLLADDVGLGKTISAGLIISELISRSRLSKILIVCPKLLAAQWQEELLAKFDITSEIAIGQDLIDADPDEIGAIITTYQSARLHLDAIPKERFQMLILDEAHKLRNLYGVETPPQVAKCFRKALEERRFRFVLMLTATPIQNRLWDLYSLIDLLTVARGHQNPFGSEGMFARKFIADNRDKARQLKPDAREEFRSIVYGYMSRIRRGDAKLYFPDRVVQMHKVDPTKEELQLIATIAKPIQSLNRLVQISILQALTSSPDALMAQLTNMAKNGTVPEGLAATVRGIVRDMPISAKLHGLGTLIERLKRESPERWRLVVFTGRLETQTTIQAFLENHGLKVGIINGMSGPRNQDTLVRFRKNPPVLHVIVSTEAGSEGLNLQVANVLVNYDLPWNPMIVEQRIGRVQRLASEHASVGIFNIMLRGTFEEYIVGRLMEKLQMASHAIGDIEALLEASGISGEDENGATGFDEQIRQLIIAALAGKDVELATRQTEKSIADAKITLEREQGEINSMLGGMDGAEYVGPRAPVLPGVVRSMNPEEFTLAAYKSFGGRITPQGADMYLVEENGGGRKYIRFKETNHAGSKSVLYAPGTGAFQRLVERTVATGIHAVQDTDTNPAKDSEEMIRQWVKSFGAIPMKVEIEDVQRCFDGIALVRVRATVAHDSYERLVEIPCLPGEHDKWSGRAALERLSQIIEECTVVGLSSERLAEAAQHDAAISEFSRFYLERRAQEMQAADGDERKRKRLEEEFTPRLEMNLIALEGKLHRQVKVRVRYQFDGEAEYGNTVMVNPHGQELLEAPAFGLCTRSGRMVPVSCLKRCEITGAMVLQHLLVASEMSKRLAVPEFSVLCSISGKRVLKDEAESSAVTGRLVAVSLLKTSAMSGKRAEPHYFAQCEFTKSDVLITELAISEVSGKNCRGDELIRSVVSGKSGHTSEFIVCSETKLPLILAEAEQCEVTSKYVRPGVLEQCEVTQKWVLSGELEKCVATGKRALKKCLVTSSVSGARILEEVAIRSATAKFCTPVEAKHCVWSGRKYYPDDLRTCELTHLPIHFEFTAGNDQPRLQPLLDMLNGLKRTADEPQLWTAIAIKAVKALGNGRCRVEVATLSPDRRHLAVCTEVRTLLGFRVRQVGWVYSIDDDSLIGRPAQGRRTTEGWMQVKG
jgi:ERCC4-related helicase